MTVLNEQIQDQEIDEALEIIVTKLPPHIKQWYIKTASDLGQKTQPYASLILINHANENGAKKEKK